MKPEPASPNEKWSGGPDEPKAGKTRRDPPEGQDGEKFKPRSDPARPLIPSKLTRSGSLLPMDLPPRMTRISRMRRSAELRSDPRPSAVSVVVFSGSCAVSSSEWNKSLSLTRHEVWRAGSRREAQRGKHEARSHRRLRPVDPVPPVKRTSGSERRSGRASNSHSAAVANAV